MPKAYVREILKLFFLLEDMSHVYPGHFFVSSPWFSEKEEMLSYPRKKFYEIAVLRDVFHLAQMS